MHFTIYDCLCSQWWSGFSIRLNDVFFFFWITTQTNTKTPKLFNPCFMCISPLHCWAARKINYESQLCNKLYQKQKWNVNGDLLKILPLNEVFERERISSWWEIVFPQKYDFWKTFELVDMHPIYFDRQTNNMFPKQINQTATTSQPKPFEMFGWYLSFS